MLVVVGRWITSLGSPGHFTGWTGFAPLQNTAPLFPGAGLHAWARVLVWLILIAVWATVSLIVLKDESNSDHDVPSP